MIYDKNNIFYKIIQKKIPATIVYEDDSVIAFKDIAPIAPTHVLVIPKADIATFGDLCDQDPSFIGNFFKKVHLVAQHINVSAGYKINIHNGAEGGQEIFHLHAHILAH